MALEPQESFKPRRLASFTIGTDKPNLKHKESIVSVRSRKEIRNDPDIDVDMWKAAGRYRKNLQFFKRNASRNLSNFFREDGQNVVTAIYCKILVLIGICFSLSETLTDKIPPGYYSLFYVYLVLGSLIFLMFVYIDLIRFKAMTATQKKRSWIDDLKKNLFTSHGNKIQNILKRRQSSVEVNEDDIPRPKNVYGSLYLRFGAVSKNITVNRNNIQL